MKRVFALILAVMMIAALSVTAFAAEGNQKQKTYVAYQVFTGDEMPSTEEGVTALTNIQWGDGVNSEALLEALKNDPDIGAKFTPCTTAETVAIVVGTFADDSDEARAFAALCCKNKTGDGIALPLEGEPDLEPGYYLVYDATEYEAEDKDSWRNLSLLQVTGKGAFEIKQKVTVPEVEKEVYEESTEEWQKAADYDIGDAVPFKMTATVPDIRAYKCYQLIFHDTLSEGLSFDKTSLYVHVYVVSDDTTFEVYDDKGSGSKGRYNLNIIDDRNFEVKLNDLVTLDVKEGDQIIVTYEALLNNKAVIGDAGNPNKVYLRYSNNPQDECGGEMGTTPEDEITVYSWGIDINKVTEAGPLAGASFTLTKINDDGTETALGEKEVQPVYDENGDLISYTASFGGQDSGTYRIHESVVPFGYNGIDDITYTITATFEEENIKEFVVDNGFEAVKGIVYADILNKVGIVLPETGGAGTKALTAVGACALICGLVFGITKKRAGEAD